MPIPAALHDGVAAATCGVLRLNSTDQWPLLAALAALLIGAAPCFDRLRWERTWLRMRATLAAVSAHGLRGLSKLPHGRVALERAVDFELPASDGSRVRLSTELARGPVLLVFFRGAW
jgi:hypothetical protein